MGPQIAGIIGQVLGERVTHVNLPQDALTRYLIEDVEMDAEFAQFTSMMDETIVKAGSENRLNDVIESLTGKPPRSFGDYAKASRHLWI